ncbi:vomeronasal type-2 receptor 26-like [Pelodytes ibericus]
MYPSVSSCWRCLQEKGTHSHIWCRGKYIKKNEDCIDVAEYRTLLTFIFVIDEINKDPDILPNVTLGYHVFDSCGNAMNAIQYVLRILSGNKREAPNYSCREQGKVAGFIGDLWSITSLPMAQVLSVYGYTQITYGSTTSLLRDENFYPFIFHTVPDAQIHYWGILKLLKHFGWNFVGIITSEDDKGDRELRDLSYVITSHGICIEFIIKISDANEDNEKRMAVIKKSTSQLHKYVKRMCYKDPSGNKVFFNERREVISKHYLTNWKVTYYENKFLTQHCLVGILDPSRQEDQQLEVAEKLIHWKTGKITPEQSAGLNQPFTEKEIIQTINKIKLNKTPGPDGITGSFYKTMKTSISKYMTIWLNDLVDKGNIDLEMLKANIIPILKPNKNPTLIENYRPISLINEDIKIFAAILADRFRECIPSIIHGQQTGFIPGRKAANNIRTLINLIDQTTRTKKPTVILSLDAEKAFDRIPQARCNDHCPVGYRKAPNGGYHACCYDCVRCSEGDVSNKTDSDNCHPCPDTEWPDEAHVNCIPKTYIFLSYEEDIMAAVFSFISLLFLFILILILGLFIVFRDTPIVRANNQNLSFLLLVSMLLTFLCVFLFLGRPEDITCMLRQTSFGIIFSVSVSSILAKTVMVCIAFKAIKPGSSWKKWLGAKVSNYTVLLCSSVQILINVFWLSISTPFQEFDMHSYPGKIIIQCNEGSVIAFYSVLGYMGILAAMSFVLAFMVRTLPDSFNEAKYITFSMLVFGSVWIAMIPAYLSTKGKDMVSVEIFAILASNTGVVGCIFFPKCYILLMRPEMNSRSQLLGKT